MDRELETFFPAIFNTSAIKEYYSRLKRRTLVILQAIQAGTDPADQVAAIDEYFLLQFKPRSFHGPQGAEVQTIKAFEEMCIILSQNGMTTDAKNMTTLAFFQALELIKAQAKQKEKAATPRRR